MVALLLSRLGVAQGTISTVAGGSGFLDNIPATEARLDGPYALAVDTQGNAYIADGSRIRRVDAQTGIISTVAANLNEPASLALDAGGNLLFTAGGGTGLYRLVLATGAATLIAGDPLSVTPQFGIISGVATDRAGNIYMTAEFGKIYRIDATTQAVTTIAGKGMANGPGTGDGGLATQATLARPGPITLDSAGNIFEDEQYAVRRIDAQTGIITTVAPVNSNSTGDGGPFSKATLDTPRALATDVQGNLYIADGILVRKINWSTGIISTVAGSGNQQYGADGVPALQANLSGLLGISIDSAGDMWLADAGNRRLFLIPAATGLIQTLAGTSANGDGGPALGALLAQPVGIVVNGQGDLYFSQAYGPNGDTIRRVDHSTGFISTVAQLGTQSAYGGQIAIDAAGNLFFAGADRINRIDAISGTITTVAGGSGNGLLGDGGPATAALLCPGAVAVDSSGNLFIADSCNLRIRRVDATTGIITTIAGNGGPPGGNYDGTTGQATQIAIGVPLSIAISPAGQVYWTVPGWLLTVDLSGVLSIVAGNGDCTYAGDGGPATLASLCQSSLAFDSEGNLFVGGNAVVRRIDSTNGLIQTVAGAGDLGQSADGIAATQASLIVGGVAVSGTNLYIIDNGNSQSARIRLVAPATPPPMPQPPKISQIVDAVSDSSRYSPGELVSLMGNYLGSPVPASAQLGADGKVTSSLAGDQVTFNGIAAPLLYVSAAQINVVIPYQVKTGNAVVQVKAGAGTDQVNVSVDPTSLALYPQVFNPDGTLNSSTNLAPKGATLVMYGTGMGQTNPAGVDGAIIQGPTFPTPVNLLSAIVGNGTSSLPAQIAYAGPLPGAIAGVMQVNVVIPPAAFPGKSTLVLKFSGSYSVSQTIYMLSDPPVLTGVTPASPIPQTVGFSNNITLNGSNLNGVASANFFQNGTAVNLQPFVTSCSAGSCVVSVSFNGQSGDFSVTVTNAAGQTSNRVTFTVQPPPPPAVTSIDPVPAIIGVQPVFVVGTNFEAPLSADIYYNGSVVQTLSSAVPGQIISIIPTSFYMNFNSQGKPGQYGIVVTGPNGSSALFNFTVVAP